MISNKSKEALTKGINNYLMNGCADIESFEDPVSEVVDYLNALFSIDIGLAEDMCKKTLKTKNVDSDFFKAICLNDLLLSDSEWSFAFNYLLNETENVSIPELEKAMFYFYCAKNETDPYPVPEGLFKKLMERYEELKDDPDAKFYHLHETYNDFSKAYSLSN
ncbi:hypothetical protein [Serratia fonticola]